MGGPNSLPYRQQFHTNTFQLNTDRNRVIFFFIHTIKSRSPTCSRPSFCAAPPSMILVTYMLLSPGMCWFPTPPAMLKPSPVLYIQTRSWLVSGWVVVCVCCLTFWSFDEFDLNDGLYHGPAAPNIQPNNRACNLKGLHCFTVRNLRHVCVVNPQNAVVYSGRQSSNLATSMMGNNLEQLQVIGHWSFLVSMWEPVS